MPGYGVNGEFETPYAETEAFLAVLNDDTDRLRELLAEMTSIERKRLANKADDLSNAVDRYDGIHEFPRPPRRGD